MTSAVGIPPRTDPLTALVAQARERNLEPASVVAAAAERSANGRDRSLLNRGLRLFERTSAAELDELASALGLTAGGASNLAPAALGRLHELLMQTTRRRASGAHLTPAAVAAGICRRVAADAWLRAERVCDPSVGGGAFLLGALDRLCAVGVAPRDAVGRIDGVDLDPLAVAVAESAVALWALQHDVEPTPMPGLRVGDGLLSDLGTPDIVVGNPPFLAQLRRDTAATVHRRRDLAHRWGDLVGAYTDEAWLFLAASVETVRAGGTVTLIQPMSVLGARDAAAVRASLLEQADLVDLWLAFEPVFDAAVNVCSLTLRRHGAGGRPPTSVLRCVGRSFEPVEAAPAPDPGAPWGPLAAQAWGVPSSWPSHATPRAGTGGDGTVGEMADATAGFRRQFYGFVPFVREHAEDRVSDELAVASGQLPRLVTVGMIDPFELRWGSEQFRFAGERVTAPVVDLGAIGDADGELAAWCAARSRPKVLVATQSRVVEVVIDPEGLAMPVTPVISVEPHNPDDVWLLGAALSAPPVAARLLSDNFGTALSLDALKVSARQLLAVAQPTDDAAWQAGADVVRELQNGERKPQRRRLFEEFAAAMCAAYGLGADAAALVDWWMQRLPKRSTLF